MSTPRNRGRVAMMTAFLVTGCHHQARPPQTTSGLPGDVKPKIIIKSIAGATPTYVRDGSAAVSQDPMIALGTVPSFWACNGSTAVAINRLDIQFSSYFVKLTLATPGGTLAPFHCASGSCTPEDESGTVARIALTISSSVRSWPASKAS